MSDSVSPKISPAIITPQALVIVALALMPNGLFGRAEVKKV